ncbi:FlgO family outer membrane protein [uncultured Pseudodesulfovibrio sp.]|uniref:FlgO family outer membrane protein n=1 Tax=uncultured Pseudodesulfovibrio sp. TaxID=2035858 RepID=UPI0029C91BBD|nr:FlgO family outer membrane protein [uncultured Pseudodesulfovibrio sp.]
MNKAVLILLTISTTLLMAGCGNRMWEDSKEATSETFDYVFDTAPTARSYHETSSIPLIELNYRAADVLYSNVGKGELTLESAVFVKPFTNQNDPGDNAIFGSVVTQQIADRLVQRGVLITEGSPNVTDYLYKKDVNPEKYKNLTTVMSGKLPPRSGMLTGNYVIGDNYVYMSSKVVRLVDSAVVSAHNWTLPISDNIRQMLPQLTKSEGMVPTVKNKFD